MAYNSLIVALLTLACCLCCSPAVASPDEERYVPKEYNRDLYDWINNVARYGRVQTPPTLCKYPNYLANSLPNNIHLPKRNSELINSLLSLPKNMNEAGK